MKCPHCGSSDNNGVYRKYPIVNLYVRERICHDCGRRFHTKEEIYDKDGKETQPQLDFDPNKSKQSKTK